MRTVLLIGIDGVYNYGCEAIVRGTEAILRSEWPDIRIVYASRRPDDDAKRLVGARIEVVHRPLPGRYSPANVMRKIVSSINIRWSPMMESLRLLRGLDAVFLIGGDIYTLSPSGNFEVSLPKFGETAERMGVPYVIWGASIGPFTEMYIAEHFYVAHLRQASLITAREQDTIQYLASIGIYSNIVSCADPAFAVAPEIFKKQASHRTTKQIALNLSPISARYAGKLVDEATALQARAVERIITTHGCDIILVPHVVCSADLQDDDVSYLINVYHAVHHSFRNRIHIHDCDCGFVGVKKILTDCDMVIAARMHCAINALTAHVPTILLSYSQKAQGMCKYIYGHCDYVMPVSEFGSAPCMTVIGNLMERQSSIIDYLAKRIPEVQKETYHPIQALRQLFRRVDADSGRSRERVQGTT